ncbi:serine/threonine-protein kinase [Myxococcota bacterium]|nr:serine/threonine-protein kinase [Myxococcota bacterium]
MASNHTYDPDDEGRADDGASGPRSKGDEASRYVLGETLGEGGMGVVRRGLDTRLGREVAIKVLTHAHAAAQARFVAEAKVTAALEHPNVVPVHDIGVDEEGRPFLVMKWVRGRSLSALSDQLHPRDALELFRKVCDAVAFAHSRGVLHRDIKPENVMIGEFGEVTLLDWGLAYSMGRAPEGGSQVAGTPAYMAPEQVAGALDSLDARTDVYGLGAVLYELMVRAPPFAGPTKEVLAQVRQGALQPPRRRRPTVSRELEAIILRAMSPRPEDRYPSVLALRADIDAVLDHRPLVGLRSTWAERLTKWATRHRGAVRAAGAVGAAALLVLLLGVGQYTRAVGEARDDAVAEAERARQAELEALRGLLRAQVGRADALVLQGEHAEAARALADAERALAETSPSNRARVDRRALDLARSAHTLDGPLPVATCRPHGNAAVLALGLGPDHQRALSFGADGRLVAWDLADCEERGALALSLPAFAAAARADAEGDQVIVAVEGGVMLGRLGEGWSALIPSATRPWRVGFNDAGPWVADGVGGAFQVVNGALEPLPEPGVARWTPGPSPAVALAVTTGSDPHAGGVWVDGVEKLRSMGANDVAVTDDRSVALVASSALVEALSVDTQAALWTLRGDPTRLVGVAPGGRLGWRLGFDGALTVFNLRDGVGEHHFVGPAQVNTVATSEDARIIALGGTSGEVHVFLRPIRGGRRVPLTEVTSQGVAVSPDGERVAVTDDDGVVTLADLPTGAALWRWQGATDQAARQVKFSPDGRRLAVAKREEGIILLTAATGQAERVVPMPHKVVAVDWSGPDRLVTVTGDGALWVINPDDGATRRLGVHLKGASWDTTILSPARVVIAGHLDSDGERLVIDLDTGAVVQRLSGGAPAYHHAVSPDGRTLAVGNQRGEVELWDLQRGVLTSTLQADSGPTMAVAFSPDGALLATAGFSERVMLWDPSTGERLRAEAQHIGPALNLCFTPDGAALLSTGADGGIAVLPLTMHTRWAEAVADLRQGVIARARALARLGWWERLHAAQDAAVAAGAEDDLRARARARWMVSRDDAAIGALLR